MTSFIRFCGLLVVFLIFSPVSVIAQSADTGSAQKAVLVTGASTGIGRKITEVFADKGYFVYAGARKQKDLDALNAIANVQAYGRDGLDFRLPPERAAADARGTGLRTATSRRRSASPTT